MCVAVLVKSNAATCVGGSLADYFLLCIPSCSECLAGGPTWVGCSTWALRSRARLARVRDFEPAGG